MQIFLMMCESEMGKRVAFDYLKHAKMSTDDVDYVMVCNKQEKEQAEVMAERLTLSTCDMQELKTCKGMWVIACYHS